MKIHKSSFPPINLVSIAQMPRKSSNKPEESDGIRDFASHIQDAIKHGGHPDWGSQARYAHLLDVPCISINMVQIAPDAKGKDKVDPRDDLPLGVWAKKCTSAREIYKNRRS